MKLSISNISWSETYDESMYGYLQNEEIFGLEIAPTRIFKDNPYDKLNEAKIFADKLKSEYGLIISSIQSIWFGKAENIFSSDEERLDLINYTKKTIDFASVIGCTNIVFGCPKNRNMTPDSDVNIAIDFFKILGEYANTKKTFLAIEPNPTIYNTNFINTTNEAFEVVKKINSGGIMVNVDLGTIIQNNENLNILKHNMNLVNHIHISEPFLEQIKEGYCHKQLAEFLKSVSYDKFVSIEMKNLNDIDKVKNTIKYIKGVFS